MVNPKPPSVLVPPLLWQLMPNGTGACPFSWPGGRIVREAFVNENGVVEGMTIDAYPEVTTDLDFTTDDIVEIRECRRGARWMRLKDQQEGRRKE